MHIVKEWCKDNRASTIYKSDEKLATLDFYDLDTGEGIRFNEFEDLKYNSFAENVKPLKEGDMFSKDDIDKFNQSGGPCES